MWIHWESSILHELKLNWDVSHTSKTEARDNQITLHTILIKIAPSVTNPLPQSSCLHILYRKPSITHSFILVPTSIPSFSKSSCIFHHFHNYIFCFLLGYVLCKGLEADVLHNTFVLLIFLHFWRFTFIPQQILLYRLKQKHLAYFFR